MAGKDFLKDHLTYETVLNECHAKGIQSVELIPELCQMPWTNDAGTAVIAVRVTMKDGSVWEEIGDANDANVGNRLIALHKIRMAATRAKGRAMRDAVNKGKALAEEMDVPLEDDHEPPARTGKGTGTAPAPAPDLPFSIRSMTNQLIRSTGETAGQIQGDVQKAFPNARGKVEDWSRETQMDVADWLEGRLSEVQR